MRIDQSHRYHYGLQLTNNIIFWLTVKIYNLGIQWVFVCVWTWKHIYYDNAYITIFRGFYKWKLHRHLYFCFNIFFLNFPLVGFKLMNSELQSRSTTHPATGGDKMLVTDTTCNNWIWDFTRPTTMHTRYIEVFIYGNYTCTCIIASIIALSVQ